MKLDHLFTPCTRINSTWNKGLNVTHEIIKILEGNIGSKITDIPCSNMFSDVSPWAREIKLKNKQMGLYQTKEHLRSKENHQQNKKTTHRMGEHIHQ